MANPNMSHNHIFVIEPSTSNHSQQNLSTPLNLGFSPARLTLPANNQETKDQQHTTSPYSTPNNTPHPRTGFVVYPETLIHEGVKACSRNILGKFITDKPIHINLS